MPKKRVTVNLHNPHKPPEDKEAEIPGPATYTKIREFDVSLNRVLLNLKLGPCPEKCFCLNQGNLF